MRIIKIEKRPGKFRIVVDPGEVQRESLRVQAHALAIKAEKHLASAVHGFRIGHNAVTAAKQHIGYDWTISIDLADFFDHVKVAQVKDVVPAELIQQLELIAATVEFPGRIALQGLPTSPVIANLAARGLDTALERLAKKHKWVYTRYADDLTFSGHGTLQEARQQIPQIIQAVTRSGWKINQEKTSVQHKKGGYRTVLGISVGDKKIYASRKAKRLARASKHAMTKPPKIEDIFYSRLSTEPKVTRALQHRAQRARGHAEWCSLKVPQPHEEKKARVARYELPSEEEMAFYRTFGDVTVLPPDPSALSAVAKEWKCKKSLAMAKKRVSIFIFTKAGIVITNDPIQTLGASNLTSGWTSCLAHPHGSHRVSSMALTNAGAWLAYTPGSKKIQIVKGIERQTMATRTWLWKIGNSFYHDSIYPISGASEQESPAEKTRKLLESEMGIAPVGTAP